MAGGWAAGFGILLVVIGIALLAGGLGAGIIPLLLGSFLLIWGFASWVVGDPNEYVVQAVSVFCVRCGTENVDGWDYCRRCGEALPSAE